MGCFAEPGGGAAALGRVVGPVGAMAANSLDKPGRTDHTARASPNPRCLGATTLDDIPALAMTPSQGHSPDPRDEFRDR